MTMKIGIYGGTFDPIHRGHMVAAQTAAAVLGLDQLLLIPAGIPPHKALPNQTAAPEHRLNMTQIAADRLGLAISRGVSLLAATAGEAEPVSDLATDTCIEWRALARCALVNAVLLPTVLLALAACLVRRRPLSAQS